MPGKLFLTVLSTLATALMAVSAEGQFREDFNALRTDPSGKQGWRYRTGDGLAAMELHQGGEGYASVVVDATADRRNIWWALVQREALQVMKSQAGQEVRVAARIRVSDAPRRVNLQVQTQRTTDYHAHLMEFDIAEANRWETISMTTRGFDARPGDTLIAHMALMDWGLGQYRVDVDWVTLDVVDCTRKGENCLSSPNAVPYHPPIRPTSAFRSVLPVAYDTTLDSMNSDVNLDDWADGDVPVLTVSPAMTAILRWDFKPFEGRKAKGSGLLELTTRSIIRKTEEIKDSGLLRVSEINGRDTINPQPIIDWPASTGEGSKTYLTISEPVLQRLIDGRATGIAIRALGPLSASFCAMEGNGDRAARLWFNLE
jgi:hypothetical protein